jgi:hypothetical protein
MSWYYAENNERRGPIEDSAFTELVRNGTVKPETLVWREGMANWQPYAQASGTSGTTAPIGAMPAGAPGTARCSSCGNFFPESDLITIAGRAICATCKPRVVQQMVEGADTAGAGIDQAKLLADLRAQGGYPLDIGDLVSRAWRIVKPNLWPCIGTTLLCFVIMIVAQQIPCLGIIAVFLVDGPLVGGLNLYFLKQLRAEPAVVGDAFLGFQKPQFGQLALCGTTKTVLSGIIMGVLMVPAFIGLFSKIAKLQSNPGVFTPEMLLWNSNFVVWIVIAAIPVSYLRLCWILSYAFIIDQRLRFWDAMELSRKLVNMRFGKWIPFLIVMFLLTVGGTFVLGFVIIKRSVTLLVLFLTCGLVFGLLTIFCAPVVICMLLIIYEDILKRRMVTS